MPLFTFGRTQYMIPKTIHYCWMGRNPLDKLALKCIASWKKYCPDYQIIEWNEDSFDVNSYAYTREAYGAKKWAFVSDVVRLYAIVNYGGVYMDTDVEVIRPLDGLLKFPALSGFETDTSISTGLMACEKGHPAFAEFLKEYDDIHFLRENGSYDDTTNVTRITHMCLKYGLRQDNTEQTLANGLHILPKDYLCPKDYATGRITLTANTYTIHHFNASWMSAQRKIKGKILQTLRRCHVPNRFIIRLEQFLTVKKFREISGIISMPLLWFMKKLGLKKKE